MNLNLICKRTLGLGVALAMTAPSAMAGAPVDSAALTRGVLSISKRLIVKYHNAVSDPITPTVVAAAARRGLTVRALRRTALGADVLEFKIPIAVTEVQAMAREVQSGDINVQYAEADRFMHALSTPNDPSVRDQWHYIESVAGINAPGAWDKATGEGVVVAVIDTGFWPHADLVANLVSGFDFISASDVAKDGDGRDADASDPGDFTRAGLCAPGEPAFPSSWHGTHVAGTIAAVTNNALDVAGVAFNAKVQPVRALGLCGGFMSDISDAIVWASGGSVSDVPPNPTPARVINLSLGGPGTCDKTAQVAIDDARSRGAVVVVAAGNEARSVNTSSPANCSGVIAVSAVGRAGARAGYSNFGARVDLAAPGGDGADGVLSTVNAGETLSAGDALATFQGTSMAAAHVSAVAALMLSANPALTPDQLEAQLKATARPFLPGVSCNLCGAGLLDASRAVDAARGVPVPPLSTPTPTFVAEVEPNSFRTPQVLPDNSAIIVDGSVALLFDPEDSFSITVAPGNTLTAVLTPMSPVPPLAADLELFVSTDLEEEVSTENGPGVPDVVVVRNSGTALATVQVMVFGKHLNGSVPAWPYRLSVLRQ